MPRRRKREHDPYTLHCKCEECKETRADAHVRGIFCTICVLALFCYGFVVIVKSVEQNELVLPGFTSASK
jgi:hypothetical protein